MLSIALRSKWSIANFVAGTLINLLQFLSAVMVLSFSACSIWLVTFFVDMILINSLRNNREVKHYELPHFSFDGPLYEPFVNTIREHIALYLISDAITADMTAESLDNMLPANWYLKSPNIFVPSSVHFVWRLWETFAQFAIQIPHDHCKQDELIQLIVALSKRPTVLVRHRDTLLRFWDAMPQYNLFIAVIGNMLLFDDTGRHQIDKTQKTNLMAFFARVQATGLPHGLISCVGWSLHTALAENRHDVLPLAALWIEHCGDYLWWSVCQMPNCGIILDKPLWTHYMEQFGKLAADGRNERSLRLLAQDAFRTMARLTESAPDPKFDNIGEHRWNAILAREGPQGRFEEPIAPDLWEEEEYDEEDDDEQVYEGEYEIHLGREEVDPNGFHPLRPLGGFLLYSDITEEDESRIARAA